MKKVATFALSLSLNCIAFSQTQFWVDNFEGSPSSGTRTPEENGGVGGPPNTSYFRLTDGSTVSQVVAFTGKQGTNYWAGEDHNAAGTGFTASGAQGAGVDDPLDELSITWTGINISGKTGLSFRGLFAANNTSSAWDTKNTLCDGLATTNTDYVIVQYSIDGGGYVDLIRFFNKGGVSNPATKSLFEDTDGNGCGDGVGLTSTFGEFIKSIPGTGTTLSIRLLVYSEGNNEEWGVDNFRLFYTSALPVELTSFSNYCENQSEVVTWSSQSELNFDHYELLQSENGRDFEKVAIIPPMEHSATFPRLYSYSIGQANRTELLYYQLKMVDIDGSIKTSAPLLSKTCEPLKSNLLLSYHYEDGQLTIVLTDPNSIVELFSLTGQSVGEVLHFDNETMKTINFPTNGKTSIILKITTIDQLKSSVKLIHL